MGTTVTPPNPTGAQKYVNSGATADKQLMPDGSVTTAEGTLISGANPTGAQQYVSASAIPNKWLMPDGFGLSPRCRVVAVVAGAWSAGPVRLAAI